MANEKEYLVYHDYGQGGLLAILSCSSEEEIYDKFNDVNVLNERPNWLDEDRYNNLIKVSIQDVSNTWLETLAKSSN